MASPDAFAINFAKASIRLGPPRHCHILAQEDHGAVLGEGVVQRRIDGIPVRGSTTWGGGRGIRQPA
jgi:hypothetical protein